MICLNINVLLPRALDENFAGLRPTQAPGSRLVVILVTAGRWNSAFELRQMSLAVLLINVPSYTCLSRHFINVFSTFTLKTNFIFQFSGQPKLLDQISFEPEQHWMVQSFHLKLLGMKESLVKFNGTKIVSIMFF